MARSTKRLGYMITVLVFLCLLNIDIPGENRCRYNHHNKCECQKHIWEYEERHWQKRYTNQQRVNGFVVFDITNHNE